jgi:hypothetical protein
MIFHVSARVPPHMAEWADTWCLIQASARCIEQDRSPVEVTYDSFHIMMTGESPLYLSMAYCE